MDLDKLKQEVLNANLELVKRNLVISTWGNVSGYDPERKLVVIKASGIHYETYGCGRPGRKSSGRGVYSVHRYTDSCSVI